MDPVAASLTGRAVTLAATTFTEQSTQSPPARLPEAHTVQLRVVSDQPWDVRADVLVVPIVGDPSFDGPLDEIDRRSGGELRALAEFGELTGKRYSTALAGAGETRAPGSSRSGRRGRQARP